VRKKVLYIEVASTPYEHQQGLMFRKHLPKHAGMLFKFPQSRKLQFWGMNTFIPLDIAFISNDNKITKIGRIKPYDLTAVASDEECCMALEANDGYFGSNGIKVGDVIRIEREDNTDIIVFNPDDKVPDISLRDIFS